MSDRKRNGFILLIVAGLVAASIVVIVSMSTVLGLDLKGGVELVYQGQPTAQSKVTQAALNRAVDVMRNRVDQLGVSQPSIKTQSGGQIIVQLPSVKNVAQAESEVGTTARLEFYDWEANVLTPAGKPAADGLLAQQADAVTLSQGSGSVAPGSPSPVTGAMGLYGAVQLASKQPYTPRNRSMARIGDQYFLFGAPGSKACAQLAASSGSKPLAGVHCLLAGPAQPPLGSSRAAGVAFLELGIPALYRQEGQALVVPQGTVVVQAAPTTFAHWAKLWSPLAGYYVMRDHVAVFGSQITNPQQSTGSDGLPDVQFGFTSKGNSQFSSVTAAIAARGARISVGSQHLYQHFAAALDQQLLTVPEINYVLYPDGISGGADISGSFTIQSAQSLATELRLGALPINLKLISKSQVSATLGAQALHQGLIAGVVGLSVVVLFLLAYYRLLGLIAIGGLVAYGLYFYALIKLIPITLTLAGIAGLILTIGVAADANIVIFERVKEEIRGGRSIRQGIVTGYRKGLTAIIDANVVTIMTAFILFVLATADVQGFAFTLGIGTFVSLFTAVMATQAILLTMGNSKVISRPSALGAGGRRRVWKYDFMGASRYFFTMSGMILLIGALAIGGRGLNLGIDFTSGTQISVGLQRPATQNQIKTLMATVGQSDATIQAVHGNRTLGPNGFQIDSKYLRGNRLTAVESGLQTRFGVRTSAGSQDLNVTTVGPTFGSAVARSAIIAIIASLIVISLYVALRFDWKFAVPVLIALAHDLLITAGVYALTGRQVTTDTVAALLTILGYSMYDTIIVFDRVRENVPRMPRAAFSQIVNRSMSEVLTRSIATTTVTLLPITALLIFGGSTLGDFAFALLIGVASGAYSSIFIASPVLTHWKEREHGYRLRHDRLIAEHGYVPAYAAGVGTDVEPKSGGRGRRRPSSPLAPEQDVSNVEFEQMKRDLGLEEERPSRHTRTLTSRAAHHEETELDGAIPPAAAPATPPGTPPAAAPARKSSAPAPVRPTTPAAFQHAPDAAEEDGVSKADQAKRGASKARRPNRKHGRR